MDGLGASQDDPHCYADQGIRGCQLALSMGRDYDQIQDEIRAAVEHEIRDDARAGVVIERSVDACPSEDGEGEQPDRVAGLQRPRHKEHRRMPDAPCEREYKRGQARREDLFRAWQSERAPA